MHRTEIEKSKLSMVCKFCDSLATEYIRRIMKAKDWFVQNLEVHLKFISYYKYSFQFETPDGSRVWFGGESDDIYKWSVTRDTTVAQLGAHPTRLQKTDGTTILFEEE